MRDALTRTTVGILLLTCSISAADTDLRAFVGTWRENQSKSRPFISGALTYTFTAEPNGFVTIVRGNVPLRDTVRFDGKDYPTPGVAAERFRGLESTISSTNQSSSETVL